ncbi:MAG TPA: hypothetical protein VHT53_09805 [Candidatus Elarobacter sp.]|jgi:hypothetical protein|nr:hypothetical protein [Candidatus Elarobacter sp.]
MRDTPTVDAYLARLSDDKRTALQVLRRTIRAALPRAEECISYKMPAFRLRFTPDRPLPASIVRKLVKARLEKVRASIVA